MPSHAIPPGRDGRELRGQARRRRLLSAWQRLPLVVLPLTCVQVAGLGEPLRGSAVSVVLQVIRVGLLGAVVMVACVLSVVVLPQRLRWWAGTPVDPRPRWLYLLASLGSLAAAAGCAMLGVRAGDGMWSRWCYLAMVWSAGYGLVLTGRAVTWGRVRALLWWPLFTRAQAVQMATGSAAR